MRLGERGSMASCPEHCMSTWGHPGSGDLRAQQGPGVRDCSGPEEELTPHQAWGGRESSMLQVVSSLSLGYTSRSGHCEGHFCTGVGSFPLITSEIGGGGNSAS